MSQYRVAFASEEHVKAGVRGRLHSWARRKRAGRSELRLMVSADSTGGDAGASHRGNPAYHPRGHLAVQWKTPGAGTPEAMAQYFHCLCSRGMIQAVCKDLQRLSRCGRHRRRHGRGWRLGWTQNQIQP
jgi:hypothetical protein